MELKFPSEQWAVFNNHVNNAGRRAIKACRRRFGKDDPQMQALEKMDKNGIMAIFKTPPNSVTTLYANCCFVFANRLDKI